MAIIWKWVIQCPVKLLIALLFCFPGIESGLVFGLFFFFFFQRCFLLDHLSLFSITIQLFLPRWIFIATIVEIYKIWRNYTCSAPSPIHWFCTPQVYCFQPIKELRTSWRSMSILYICKTVANSMLTLARRLGLYHCNRYNWHTS